MRRVAHELLSTFLGFFGVGSGSRGSSSRPDEAQDDAPIIDDAVMDDDMASDDMMDVPGDMDGLDLADLGAVMVMNGTAILNVAEFIENTEDGFGAVLDALGLPQSMMIDQSQLLGGITQFQDALDSGEPLDSALEDLAAALESGVLANRGSLAEGFGNIFAALDADEAFDDFVNERLPEIIAETEARFAPPDGVELDELSQQLLQNIIEIQINGAIVFEALGAVDQLAGFGLELNDPTLDPTDLDFSALGLAEFANDAVGAVSNLAGPAVADILASLEPAMADDDMTTDDMMDDGVMDDTMTADGMADCEAIIEMLMNKPDPEDDAMVIDEEEMEPEMTVF